MDDLISRQAAIEINQSYHGQMPNEVNHRIWKEINELPSAQPEIVRCKDCIFHGLCRTSPKWAVAPKDDWYCADAERRIDEQTV